MSSEIWKPITYKSINGEYEVSNKGRVRSVDRLVRNRSGMRRLNGRILIPKKHIGGYKIVALSVGGEICYATVHRLVATAFIENPNDYQEINHMDEDKTNNCVENLEWCDHVYNVNYGNHNKKMSESKKLSVYAYDNDGNKVHEFASAKDASKALGFCQSGITHACNGRLATYKGLRWSYV